MRIRHARRRRGRRRCDEEKLLDAPHLGVEGLRCAVRHRLVASGGFEDESRGADGGGAGAAALGVDEEHGARLHWGAAPGSAPLWLRRQRPDGGSDGPGLTPERTLSRGLRKRHRPEASATVSDARATGCCARPTAAPVGSALGRLGPSASPPSCRAPGSAFSKSSARSTRRHVQPGSGRSEGPTSGLLGVTPHVGPPTFGRTDDHRTGRYGGCCAGREPPRPVRPCPAQVMRRRRRQGPPRALRKTSRRGLCG